MAKDARASAVALHRFGMGPRAGTIEAIASDPQGALMAELVRPGAGLVAAADLPSSGAANRAVFEYNAERNAKDKLARRQREAAQKLAEKSGTETTGMENAMAPQPEQAPPTAEQPKQVPLPRRIFLDEAKARFDAQSVLRSVSSSGWYGSGPTISASTRMPRGSRGLRARGDPS